MQKLNDEELVVWDRYVSAALVLIGELHVSSATQKNGMQPASLSGGANLDEIAANAAELADALLQQRHRRRQGSL